jgi:hypothetical protein
MKMTNKQLHQAYKQAGFETKLHRNCVTVSLNRPISIMEVQFVADIPREVIHKRSQNEIVIFGGE